VIVSGRSHDARHYRKGECRHARHMAATRIPSGLSKKLSRKELWESYWALNAAKVQLYLLRLRFSICRNERETYRKILDAWGS
jgi:hypothetical protein